MSDSTLGSPPLRPLKPECRWLRASWRDLWAFAKQHVDLNAPERQLLKDRWLEEARHYDELWRRQRRWHRLLSVIVIVAGLLTTLFAALDWPTWTLALAGFVVAVSGALDGLFRLGERWQHQRDTAALLLAEGLRFLERRDPYDGTTHRDAFPLFIDALERLNERQSDAYRALQRPERRDDGASKHEQPTVLPEM